MDSENPISSYEELKKALHDEFEKVCDHPEIVESVTIRYKPSKLVKELLKKSTAPE